MNGSHGTGDHLRIDPALSSADRELVYRLRYRAYRATDGIAVLASEQVRDEMDDLPFARSYLLRDGERVVGTVRSNVYRHGSPGHRLFLADYWPLDSMRWLDNGDTIVESARLAIDPDVPERSMAFIMRLFSVHSANAATHGARFIVSGAQRHHLPFYRQRLKFEVVSAPLQIAGLNLEPCSIMRLDYRAHIRTIEARFPDLVVRPEHAERLTIPMPVAVSVPA